MSVHQLIDISCVAQNGGDSISAHRSLFEHLSLQLRPGAITLLVGASGVGKSSLLKMLAKSSLVGRPERGLTFSGQIIWNSKKPRVAWMNQEPSLQILMPTVESELVVAAKDREDILDVSSRYGICHLLSRATNQLSNGELQRVVLAAQILRQPELLLLDEPFSHQSREARIELQKQLVEDVVRKRIAVLLTGHDYEGETTASEPWIDEVVSVDKFTTTTPTSFAQGYEVTTEPNSLDRGQAGEDSLIQARGVQCLRANGSQLSELFASCSFTLNRGQCLAITGDNGVGKSTLLRTIALAPRLPTGVQFAGELTISDLAKSRAYVDCDLRNYLFADSVQSEIEDARAEINQQRQILLKRFDVPVSRDLSPRLLSVGERQRLVLALVLAEAPTLLLLDEPTRGLDRRSRCALASVLCELLAQKNCAVIVSTHDRTFVQALGGEVCCLERSDLNRGWWH